MAITSSSRPLTIELVSAKNEKKRSTDPGVRVIGGRIYDPQNGKTCHQCRQKTMDFAASCKNLKKDKQCTIKFCHKCLLNRYGEKADEVAALDDWQCPKCRGICNCSCCMKKRGYKPTGILVHAAKENGFSSVSELLQIEGPENFSHDKIVKYMGASPEKPASSKKDNIVASPRKPGKENSFDGNSDLNLDSRYLTLNSNEKESKKTKREGLKEVSNGNRDNAANLRGSGRKKPRIAEEVSENEVMTREKDGDVFVKKKKSKKQSDSLSREEMKKNKKDENLLAKKKSEIQLEGVSKGEIKTDGKNEGVFVEKKKSKTESQEGSKKEVKVNSKADGNSFEKKKLKTKISQDTSACSTELEEGDATNCEDGRVSNGVNNNNLETKIKAATESHKVSKCAAEVQRKQVAGVQLPLGTCLTNVASTELSPEDVGHALQFLEFCASFGKVLDLKKGQAQAVIRGIINGRGGRSQYSHVAQIHIQLLSMIHKDRGEESPALNPTNGQNSWLKALGECVSNCLFMSKELPPDIFDQGKEGYENLNISKKLKLLNFLCDETLETNDLRTWIDDQNSKFLEKGKEAKEKVLAAKEKEKQLKQKMQDEVAKAIIARNGAPLSISDHKAVVSQIKREAAEAHGKMLEAMGMVPKKWQRSDAVRTDPILLDFNGRVFWRLNSYDGQSDILLQDMGTWNPDAPVEKWFVYDAEQKKEIEQYITYLRKKMLRSRKVIDTPSTNSTNL